MCLFFNRSEKLKIYRSLKTSDQNYTQWRYTFGLYTWIEVDNLILTFIYKKEQQFKIIKFKSKIQKIHLEKTNKQTTFITRKQSKVGISMLPKHNNFCVCVWEFDSCSICVMIFVLDFLKVFSWLRVLHIRHLELTISKNKKLLLKMSKRVYNECKVTSSIWVSSTFGSEPSHSPCDSRNRLSASTEKLPL